MRVADVDFVAEVVTVREKKRVRGQLTTRRVPLTKALAGVLAEYLKTHPGGQFLFCHFGEVERSKKRSRTTGHFRTRRSVRPGSRAGSRRCGSGSRHRSRSSRPRRHTIT